MNFKKKNILKLIAKKLICYVVVLLFTSTSYSIGQIINANAKLDTNSIVIGEQVTLTLSAQYTPGTKVIFPKLKGVVDDKIEIIKTSKIDSLLNNNREGVLFQKIIITSFDSGIYKIPKLEFGVMNGNIKTKEYSNELMLYVNNINVTQAKGIITKLRPNYNSPITFIEILIYILIIAAIGAGLFFGYKYLKKQKGNKPVFTFKKPPPPPHVVAIKNLDKLKDEKLWQKGKIKLYYTSLTEILRIYLEGRYKIRAMEQTTEEILYALSKTEFNDNRLYDLLNNMLITADFVKFAKSEPDPNENESALLNAYSFVNDTKQIEILPAIEKSDNEEKEVEDV